VIGLAGRGGSLAASLGASAANTGIAVGALVGGQVLAILGAREVALCRRPDPGRFSAVDSGGAFQALVPERDPRASELAVTPRGPTRGEQVSGPIGRGYRVIARQV
jgi:hypothetical protein